MTAEISFVVPFHKRTLLLERVIQGIKEQLGGRSQEIILVDDSPNNENFNFPGCIVVSTGGVGPAGARNAGAEKAQGKYLAFVDSDVILDKNWLGECLRELKKFPGIAAVQAPLAIGLLNPEMPSFLDRYRMELKTKITNGTNLYINDGSIMLNTAGLLCRKQAFLSVGGFEPKLKRNEDLYFTYKLLMEGYALSTTLATGGRVYHDKGYLAFVMKYISQAQADRSVQYILKRKMPVKLKSFVPSSFSFRIFRKICSFFYGIGSLLPITLVQPLQPFKKDSNLFLGICPETRIIFNGFELCLLNIVTLEMVVLRAVDFCWDFPLKLSPQLTNELRQFGVLSQGIY